MVWPVGLECLSFCALRPSFGPSDSTYLGSCNRSLVGADFPSDLREVFLEHAFDQPIEDVLWPHWLERLSLPGCNQPIDKVRWPPALKFLEFYLRRFAYWKVPTRNLTSLNPIGVVSTPPSLLCQRGLRLFGLVITPISPLKALPGRVAFSRWGLVLLLAGSTVFRGPRILETYTRWTGWIGQRLPLA